MNEGAVHILRQVFEARFRSLGTDQPPRSALVGAYATTCDVLLSSLLIWPRFTVIDGSVLFVPPGFTSEAEFAMAFRETVAGDAPWHLQSWCRFEAQFLTAGAAPRGEEHLDDEAIDVLDERLCLLLVESWAAKLASDFPQRRFEFRVLPPIDASGWGFEYEELVGKT